MARPNDFADSTPYCFSKMALGRSPIADACLIGQNRPPLPPRAQSEKNGTLQAERFRRIALYLARQSTQPSWSRLFDVMLVGRPCLPNSRVHRLGIEWAVARAWRLMIGKQKRLRTLLNFPYEPRKLGSSGVTKGNPNSARS